MALIGAAALMGGLNLGGSILSSWAQYNTGKEQNKIAKENLEFQKQVYDNEKALTDKYEQGRDQLKKDTSHFYNNMNDTLPTMRV